MGLNINREDEYLFICHPDIALDAEMILAVFGFHNVTVVAQKHVPNKEMAYFIKPSEMLRIPVPEFKFQWEW